MNSENFVTPNEEKAIYNLHQNSIQDEGYCHFLNRLIDPLVSIFKSKQSSTFSGLDFGSGPNPVLAQLLKKKGASMELYDPNYCNNTQALETTYDFITCTEVIEHFKDPLKNFSIINKIVKNGGHLAFMTELWNENIDFKKWHYRRDPTHISFYSLDSLNHLAIKFDWALKVSTANVAILQKN